MNGKQVLIDAMSKVQPEDDVIITIHKKCENNTTNQYVVWSEMDFVKVLGILESAKQIAQEEDE
ncbi:hypothetical protein BUZ43_00575 [Staphylococcus haemolyticus]|uniref:hypothetical protein n=1 Tax=Staphylococcus haemolyticus TaxID=1283 RepID=UPI000D1DCACA|nr:hypothetical protein [Staphylococcus haemolyticus]PTK51060.1 hypothetical protein BUZ43_00575 [Staphylococcus haemolyticus]